MRPMVLAVSCWGLACDDGNAWTNMRLVAATCGHLGPRLGGADVHLDHE